VSERERQKKLAMQKRGVWLSGITEELDLSNQNRSLNKGFLYVLRQACFHQLRREENEVRKEKIVFKMTPVLKSGELVCLHCGKTEREHPTEIKKRCSHVFEPKFDVDPKVSFYTCAWERPEKNYLISDWVRAMLSTDKAPYMCHETLNIRSILCREITEMVNEPSFPLIDRNKSEDIYGPAISFKNGIFFVKTCKFHSYVEIKQRREAGEYTHLVTHFIDEFFFYNKYMSQLMGPPVSPQNRRPEYTKPNLCCKHCGRPEYTHQKNCLNPDFCQLRCVNCNKLIPQNGTNRDTRDNNNDVCVCEEPEDHLIEVSKGLLNVSTPFVDGLCRDQFGSLDDFKQEEGILYWLFAMGGHFLLPKSQVTDWPVIPCVFGEVSCKNNNNNIDKIQRWSRAYL
jgi:hypothetical protein